MTARAKQTINHNEKGRRTAEDRPLLVNPREGKKPKNEQTKKKKTIHTDTDPSPDAILVSVK